HNGQSIPWPKAEALINEAAANDLRSVRLSGGGEPTLHPNLVDLLHLLGKHEVVLDNLTTNGAQLNERVVEALLNVKVHELKISLNSCDEKTYAQGMGLPPHFFGRVVEMTRRLSAARAAAPGAHFDQLNIQFMVYKPTMHQIRQMYDLGCELGADFI